MTMATADDLLAKLNQQQQESVSLGWGPTLVVAGAGSGKTTVLTRRVAYLIRHLHQDPGTVLAVTFTNKAAAEMKQRLERLVGPDLSRRLWIGTFHSICARLLRREIEHYKNLDGFKWQSNFVIYDETDSLNVVKAVINRLNLDDKAFPPREIRGKLSDLKNDSYSSDRFSRDARTYKENKLAEIYSAYQSELARNNALDFDDLILVFTELLKTNEEVRRRLQERFHHILVDEFQDTNQSQYELIRMLAGHGERAHDWHERSLMVVGDVDQSIYSWRKADFRIILGFQSDFKESKVVKLEENYRSTSTILAVANSIIENNSERIEKVLRCNRGQGAKVQCFAAVDEIDEAYCVVEELKKLRARGKALSDCVCLYRTNAQSRAIEEILVRNNIPYIMVGSTRFYDRAEIKDVLAYLKLTFNQHDGQSFGRVINNPRRGLGKTTLERLSAYADQEGISMMQAATAAERISDISAKNAKTIKDFAAMVARWQTLSQAVSVSALVEVVMSETKYLDELEKDARESKDPLAFGRIENVKELTAVAREFESIADEPDLESFLTRISLISDLDQAKLDQDSVKLMTLHSAKGLEFPVVFLMGLEEGLFPHSRSVNLPSALEEERRLMYVGVTRAEDLLYLSYARRRMMFGGGATTNYMIPSRFLSEISADLLLGYYPDAENPKEQNSPWQESSGGWQAGNYSGSGRQAQSSESERGSTSGYGGSIRSSGPARQPSGYDSGGRSNSPSQFEKPRVIRTGIHTGAAGASAGESGRTSSKVPDFERLVVGDAVQHVKFGVGKVVQIIGENDKELYNVEFETAGKRLLDPRFAKLVKLS
jgi:DNA helicase-2/ATP-dependent DNA helicase PcrA